MSSASPKGCLDRRGFLQGSGLAVAGLAAVALGGPVRAAAPLATQQVPGLYRHRVGPIEVTALLDGHIGFQDQALPGLFPDYDAEVAARLRQQAFVPAGAVPLAVNAYLINTGPRLILVDAGAAGALGPTLGQLPRNLAAAGLTPADVDTIILTHAHRDHAAGLLDAQGGALFPNAELVIAESELRYWDDDAAMAQARPAIRAFFAPARQALAPYRARLRPVQPGQDAAPGVTTVALPGHSPGHMGVRVHAGAEQLLLWGDVVHTQALQMPRPDWSIAFDSDPAQAAETRRRVFDMAATDRLTVAGMHMDFPGIGHVVRRVEGYGFQPLAWRSAL
ncbi:MBL fold metallo-hydrolase [Roseomonas aerophila]|uniref:MBL fold metallo-hydrolase n=1 Tax=Teichococcus aerophilus TaxID=1224513 RepID=A0ABR7RT70_9PROT|nr:MBL fold metallo-hydrolase [Pseudoroseomonas aerophila]MBC9209439.1 MBL fold metallo-hydrolase [Pseudoroseomonas aerophila]